MKGYNDVGHGWQRRFSYVYLRLILHYCTFILSAEYIFAFARYNITYSKEYFDVKNADILHRKHTGKRRPAGGIAAERALPAHIPYRPMSMLC